MKHGKKRRMFIVGAFLACLAMAVGWAWKMHVRDSGDSGRSRGGLDPALTGLTVPLPPQPPASTGSEPSETSVRSSEIAAGDAPSTPIQEVTALVWLDGVELPVSDGEVLVRTQVSKGQSARLKVASQGWQPDRPLAISAPDGGRIILAEGTDSMVRSDGSLNVDFLFEVGASPGAYVVEIKQGGHSLTIPFWAGPLPPRGKAPQTKPANLKHVPL